MNCKIVICSKDTYNNAQKTIAFFIGVEKQKDWSCPKLVSFESVEGITNIKEKQKHVDEEDAPKPAVIKGFQKNGDSCLVLHGYKDIFMGEYHYNSRCLTTSNVFFGGIKRQWKKHRNHSVYTIWDFQYHGWKYLPTNVLKEKVFLILIISNQ